MLYTIGHEANYRETIARNGSITKLPGGYVFETIDSAEARIVEAGQEGQWIVWGIDATLEQTQPDPAGGWWRLLTTEVPIIDLSTLKFKEFRKDGWPLCPECGSDE